MDMSDTGGLAQLKTLTVQPTRLLSGCPMAQTKLPLAKRITVNGHGETGSRAESSLRAQERAVIY